MSPTEWDTAEILPVCDSASPRFCRPSHLLPRPKSLQFVSLSTDTSDEILYSGPSYISACQGLILKTEKA